MAAFVALLLVSGQPAPAQQSRPGQPTAATQPARPAPSRVLEVRVEGNQALTTSAVLIHVKTRAGQPFNDEVVRQDTQRLLDTHRFDSVQAIKTPTDKGVILTFRVAERPLIKDVQIRGSKAVKLKDLTPLLNFGAGDAIDRYAIDAGKRALESKYHTEGYAFSTVTLDEKALADDQTVIYNIEEGPKAAITSIVFKGNKAFNRLVLLFKIKTKSKLWPFISGAIDEEQMNRDVEDLSSYYRDKGYLDVRITRDVVFSPDRKKATLTFTIVEGPRYRVGKTTFEGNTIYTEAEVRRFMTLTEGHYFDGDAQRRDLEKLRSLYGEVGYADTQVSVKRLFPNPPGSAESQPALSSLPALVDLEYTISESKQVRIGRIEIRGNKITRENVIRRMLQFRPEQLWDTVAIDDTKNRLKETGLFDKINVTPFGEQDDVRNALVEVQEGKSGSFMVGVGVSSNAGLIGNITYTEKNFDITGGGTKGFGEALKGAGQVLTVNLEPGTVMSRFSIDWREPYLHDKPYTLGGRLYVFTAARETYQETHVGGQVSFGHMFKNRWYAEVAMRAEEVDVNNLSKKAPHDVREDSGWSNVDGVKATLVRDRTDSIWLPSKGDKISLSVEEVFGTYLFTKAIADYHIYKTLFVDSQGRKHILAGRVMAGDIFAGDSPVFERFYGGGIGSLRGFEYRTVSPKQGKYNEPIGGDWTFFAGSEYSFPLIAEFLRGVVFVDSGTVDQDVGFGNYRMSVGTGVRIQLPFFGPVPMSLDFGIPVLKGPHDRTQIFNFNVGWTF